MKATKTRLVESDLALPLTVQDEAANLYAQWELSAAKLMQDALAQAAHIAKTREVRYPRGDKFSPTAAQFTAFQQLFDYFNLNLFKGDLPQVVLNFSRVSRKHKTLGAQTAAFFAPNRWANRVGDAGAALHEISLVPDYLREEPETVLSYLVHEMCHLQRQITGKPPRGGYHDAEWAQMMLEVGLLPVSLDNPGKMTGQKVSHRIEPQGEFRSAFLAMPAAYLLPFSHVVENEAAKKKSKNKNKVKYICPACEMTLWGKSGLRVVCFDCQEESEAGWSLLEEQKEEKEESE